MGGGGEREREDPNIIEPRSDRRDLLAIKVLGEIFTEKERAGRCEQLQKI